MVGEVKVEMLEAGSLEIKVVGPLHAQGLWSSVNEAGEGHRGNDSTGV